MNRWQRSNQSLTTGPENAWAIKHHLKSLLLLLHFDLECGTLKILRTLSRYEELEDLSEETIISILLNDALRTKISSTKNIQEQIDLVKDTIISELNKIKQESEESKKQTQKLSKNLSEKENEIISLHQTFEKLKGQRYQDEISRKSLEQKIKELDHEIKAQKVYKKADEDYRSEKDRFKTEKWVEFSKGHKIFWIFLSLFMAISIVLFFFIQGNVRYLSFAFFIAALILSFFNREKIMISFNYYLRKQKLKEKKFKEFEKEFEEKNKKPELQDFLKQNQ